MRRSLRNNLRLTAKNISARRPMSTSGLGARVVENYPGSWAMHHAIHHGTSTAVTASLPNTARNQGVAKNLAGFARTEHG